MSFRMESDEDSDAPDSIVPASSPESDLGDEAPRFPRLREPKEEETERTISPIIPLIPRTAIPGRSTTQASDVVNNIGHLLTMHLL